MLDKSECSLAEKEGGAIARALAISAFTKLTKCQASDLHRAAGAGDLDMMKLLIRAKANANKEDSIGDTPLHWAAKNCQTKCVQYLVETCGVNYTLRGSNNETALEMAKRARNVDEMDRMSTILFLTNISKTASIDKASFIKNSSSGGGGSAAAAISANSNDSSSSTNPAMLSAIKDPPIVVVPNPTQITPPIVDPSAPPSLWKKLLHSAKNDPLPFYELGVAASNDANRNAVFRDAGGIMPVVSFLVSVVADDSSSDYRRGYALGAVGLLAYREKGFGKMIVEMDPSFGWQIYAIMSKKDDLGHVPYGAVSCLNQLVVGSVPDFAKSVVTANPLILDVLEQLKMSSRPDLAQEAQILVEKLKPYKPTSRSASSHSHGGCAIHPASGHVYNLLDRKEIVMGEKIGQGGFGEVFKGMYRGQAVAIKVLLMQRRMMSSNAAEELQREADMMMTLRHENIITFIGMVEEDPVCLVTALMERGSLHSILHNTKDYPDNPELLWKRRHRLAIDMTKGLSYLHLCKPPILHRDLKSLNVLVSHDWRAQLCDFGLSKIRNETRSSTMTAASQATTKNAGGTISWMAPELLRTKPAYSEASDIYALGMVFWELASRKIPFEQTVVEQILINAILQGELEDIPDDCPEQFANVIKLCWSMDAKNRPTAQVVLSMLGSAPIQDLARYTPNWEQMENRRPNWEKHDFYSSFMLRPDGKAMEFVKSLFGNPASVTLTRVEAVRNKELQTRFDRFTVAKEEGREHGGKIFNPSYPSDQEKNFIFHYRFKPHCVSNTGLQHVQILYAWHGCSVEVAKSICARGAQDFRITDGGYFGAGVYVTLQAEYAAGYSTGTLNEVKVPGPDGKLVCTAGAGTNVTEDKEYALVLCQVSTANVYPISRYADYHNPSHVACVSNFHYRVGNEGFANGNRIDKAMLSGFDAHFATVSGDTNWQAAMNLTNTQNTFDELVLKEVAQVVPVAIVYFRPKYPKK